MGNFNINVAQKIKLKALPDVLQPPELLLSSG